MVDIYDEIGYIKNVLAEGFSQKWERDARLLVRYRRMEGIKKSVVKTEIKEKCQRLGLDWNIIFARANGIINRAWKDETPLRQIRQVEFSQEVLDWFKGLEHYCITDEQLKDIKERRHNIIKTNYPITHARVKYLFTLYIWSLIQKEYLAENPYVHYLSNYSKRFKEDADLPSSFSLKKERNLLYDLGFIYVNRAMGITTSFVFDNEVFQIPVTDSNRVIIEAGEPIIGDLYNIGKWLDKQMYGTFICESCGKEIPHYSDNKNENRRKVCKECKGKYTKIKQGHNLTSNLDIEGYTICQEPGCNNLIKIPDGPGPLPKFCPDCLRKHTRLRVALWRENQKKEDM